ncbi:MAG: rRNA adenine N-6-methyltransferase family protein [Candidatus Woesearchaeota archaeon]|jgi:tRNA (adenine57-N1/adenine58-N1)-methyltransferase|nr:rRNA adenine N-6-methyltransferase family protein [Candidatus Woesearchaeota archaeon]MDP7179929.1 rRNA adenine N-6-methyltransferase family protein [Candidatus Woesearchaeota archaeon]
MPKILLAKEGKTFFVKDETKDYHTQFGFVKAKDFKKKDGSKVKTNMDIELTLFTSNFIDDYKRIKRAPQIIPRKDVAAIVAETGVSKKSIIVDAGGGSGALASFLANIAKQVTTYEIREDFYKIIQKNKKFLNLTNLKIKNKNIYQGIEEKNVDLITLDLPSPWNAIKPAEGALKVGGFIVSYSPTIPQVMDFVSMIEKTPNLIHLKTLEIIQREWDVEERKVRPKSQPIGHSGFLTFVRKVS